MNWTLLDILLPNARRRARAVWDEIVQAAARVRSGPRRTLLLAAAVAVLLFVALVVTVRSRPAADVPTNEFVSFYCPACNRYFELNHRQFKQLWDEHQYKAGTGRSSLLFKCTYCGKLTAVRADPPKPPTQPAAPTP
jgi:hypothetical protein